MSTRRRLTLRPIIFVAALTAPALADAPIGQNGQYDTFTESDSTITDKQTQLKWQRTATSNISHDDAVVSCAVRGMRLPTIKELLTLVDEAPHMEYAGTRETPLSTDTAAFGGKDPTGNQVTPTGAEYVSQTIVNGKVLTLDFSTGLTSTAATTDNRNLRCVTESK